MTEAVETRACPYCGGAILPKALQCRHCRRWMPEIVTAHGENGSPAPTPSSSAERVSSAQRAVHLAALSVLTLGMYELYWFWRNWRDLRLELGVEVQPVWRALGLFVPIVNVVLVYDQLRMIREQCDARGVTAGYSPGLVTATFFSIAVAGNLTTFWPLSLLNVVPLLQVQVALNQLWACTQPGATVRSGLTPREVAVMIAGAVITAAALLETFGSLVPR